MAQCPVCGQPLPQGLDSQQIQTRLDRITSQARAREKRNRERHFQNQLRDRLEAERRGIQREAERQVRKDVLEAQRRAEKAESEKATEIERVRSESEKRAERAVRMAAQTVARQSQTQKKKGLCILKRIPIVESRMAVPLAAIMREGIRAIGLMRATQVGRNQKAQEL